MSKKLTYEFVKDQFEKEGYTLLSKEYKSAKVKLKYICPIGHEGTICWGNWQSGGRCRICAINGRSVNRLLSYTDVKVGFEKEGYSLLSKEYKGAKHKLEYVCPNGHRHSITWSDWKSGYRCPYCVGKGKPTIEEVRASFEKEDYTLLSTAYTNCSTKLQYICNNGHRHCISWSDWKGGGRCPHCYGNAKLTIECIKASFELEDYILISKKYNNSYSKLQYMCPKGHIHNISWNSWQNGSRCPYCAGRPPLTIDDIKKYLEKENYVLISKHYKNSGSKLVCKCPNNHVYTASWNTWRSGRRCPICANIKLSMARFGSNNPSWLGGKTFEKYCHIWFDKAFKQDIRERDSNRCLNPYCYGNDVVLSIHHIDYNKKNCHPSNLITVCRSCNTKANKDREWHKAWYQAIIKNRYGSVYYGK